MLLFISTVLPPMTGAMTCTLTGAMTCTLTEALVLIVPFFLLYIWRILRLSPASQRFQIVGRDHFSAFSTLLHVGAVPRVHPAGPHPLAHLAMELCNHLTSILTRHLYCSTGSFLKWLFFQYPKLRRAHATRNFSSNSAPPHIFP